MMRIIRLLPLILFMILGILFGIALINGKSSQTSSLSDHASPSFTLKSYVRPNALFSTNTMQRPSLLVFWASWCGVCKVDLPILSAFAQNNHIPLYGISYRDSEPLLHRSLYMFGKSVQFTDLGIDQSGEISAQYGLIGVPTLFVIAKDGTIAYTKSGSASAEELKNEVLPALH